MGKMVDRIGFEPICCPVCQTGGHPKQPHSPNKLLQQSAVVRGNEGFKSYTPTTILVSATGSSPASQASRPDTPLSGARFVLFFATHSVIITYTSTSPACASRVYMSRVGAYRTPHIQDSTFLPSCFSIISVLTNDIQPTLKNTLTCRIERTSPQTLGIPLWSGMA